MSKLLSNIKTYIIPLKLSEYDIGFYTRLINRNGGSVCQEQKDSTYILTMLKSASRISRNIENFQVPVLNIEWVKDCDKERKLLPIDQYTIMTAREKTSTTTTPSSFTVSHSAEVLNKRFKDLPPLELQFEDDQSSPRQPNADVHVDIAPEFINTKFECFRPTSYEPKFNKKLVSLFLLLEQKRNLDGEDKRSLSYRHAISAIKAYPREITSHKEAEKIIGVGKKMAGRIKDFLQTGTIDEAEVLRTDERFRTMDHFNKVFGVGVTTAKLWWDMGYRTLQEVLDNAKLTDTVRVGIKIFPDFSQPMERSDIEEIIDIIKEELNTVDKDCITVPVGGYRRGKQKNGDLDLIISKEAGSVGGLLDKLTTQLIQKNHLKHRLWHSSEVKKSKRQKVPGVRVSSKQIFDGFEKCFCAFLQPSKGILRQVDIIFVPPEELGTAILGWTGSRQFERSLRDYAKKEKGLIVSSQAIYKEINGQRKRMRIMSEKDAFEVIGVPYLEPEMRNC